MQIKQNQRNLFLFVFSYFYFFLSLPRFTFRLSDTASRLPGGGGGGGGDGGSENDSMLPACYLRELNYPRESCDQV